MAIKLKMKMLNHNLEDRRDGPKAFDGSQGMLTACILTKKFRYANLAIGIMFGYNQDELIQMGADDIHPKDALEDVICKFEARPQGEKILASNIPCLKKNDTIIYTDIDTTEYIVSGRKYNMGFFKNTTGRKKAEEKIREPAFISDLGEEYEEEKNFDC
jgi:PAS domain S-box-containing protein